jgi:predicted TIM-barrel fold metal-dependent hydrolase
VTPYRFVDADAHVEECEATWDSLDPEFRSRRPVAVTLPDAPSRGNLNSFWLVDGKVLPTPVGPGASVFATPTSCILGGQKSFSRGSQELTDIGARLRDMDAWAIDVQVVFPTVFLSSPSDDPRFEAALYRSYNSWMAEVCRQASDRLKWNAVLPLRAPAEAAAEARRARTLGAVGAAVYGTAGDRLLNDRSLDPVYAALTETGLPLCIHVGWSLPGLNQVCEHPYAAQIISFTFPLLFGFFAIVDGVLDRFPDLRVGLFEGGTQWIPYLVDRMDHYYQVDTRLQWGVLPKKLPSEYLKDGNLYVTCEADDRLLPSVLEQWGEDRVMVSSDMPHAELRDSARDEILARTDLSAGVKRKLLVDNALAFYSLK